MDDLTPLIEGYLTSADFKILHRQQNCIVADRPIFGRDRDTYVVWTIPPGEELPRYEPSLRGIISTILPKFPGAKSFIIAHSRSGVSRDLLHTLKENRTSFLVPIQFFDTAFKVEEAPRSASAIGDIRAHSASQKRIPQPFECDEINIAENSDLLEHLSKTIALGAGPKVNVIVGRAGSGKTILFRSLFSKLYEQFTTAKRQHGRMLRPIPLLPEHLKGSVAIRTEALIDNFLRTDIASPVKRETFEWLLTNGFSTWILDGLDELYTNETGFFDYLLELTTTPDTRSIITIFCRDSLLTSSSEFISFCDTFGKSSEISIYRLSKWNRNSKRMYSWLFLENEIPTSNKTDTDKVSDFLSIIDNSPSLASLSGLPFYCNLMLEQFLDGSLKEFTDDSSLLRYSIDQMINREVEKGLLNLSYFEPNGLPEWLEQIAATYIEGMRYGDIDRQDAIDYGELVLRDSLDENEKHQMLVSLLQFPLFREGSQTGLIGFTHDLIAEALAAKYYLDRLLSSPHWVGERLVRIDLEDPSILRFIATGMDARHEESVTKELVTGNLNGREFAVLLSLMMIAQPDYDLFKKNTLEFEGLDLSGVKFQRRDLSGISFRNGNLSNSSFVYCDLKGALFEGANIDRTRFEGSNNFQEAKFGDLSRVQSIWSGGGLIEDFGRIQKWIAKETGRAIIKNDPCPTALQIRSLFGKFVTPLGEPKRDTLGLVGVVAGKRYSGAPRYGDCLNEVVRQGYLVGPDFRDRFRRAEGDKFSEIVNLVRDGNISDGIGHAISRLCGRHGCRHSLKAESQ